MKKLGLLLMLAAVAFTADAFDRRKVELKELVGAWIGETREEKGEGTEWGYARVEIDEAGRGYLVVQAPDKRISTYRIVRTRLGGPDVEFDLQVIRGGDPSSTLHAHFMPGGLWFIRKYANKGYQTMPLSREDELLPQIEAVRAAGAALRKQGR